MLDLTWLKMMFLQWFTINGRISRQEYWVLFIIPIVALSNSIFNLPFLGLFIIWLFIIAHMKRLRDMNISGGKAISFWGLILLLASALAFILFLGSISGSGNIDLLETASLIFVVPFLSIILFAGFIKGSKGENKYGRKSEKLDKRSTGFIVLSCLILFSSNYIGQYINYRSNLESTLIESIKQKDLKRLQQLLAYGADSNQKSSNGKSALFLSIQLFDSQRSNDIPFELLKYGADPNLFSIGNKDEIEMQNNASIDSLNFSVLFKAILTQDLELVKTLINNGAKVDSLILYKTYVMENSSLHSEMIRLLVENGAKLNVKEKYNFSSIFNKAIENSDYDAVKLCIDYKTIIDPNILLKFDVLDGKILKLLIMNGANVNAIPISSEIDTPLMKAVQDLHFDRAKLLVKYGANPHLKSKGLSPLQYLKDRYKKDTSNYRANYSVMIKILNKKKGYLYSEKI